MECYSDQNAFITLKDHKENFRNSTKCKLINPSKSEVGLISKKYLSNIISENIEKLSKILNEADGGLYRDDGLAAVNNSNGLLMDKLRKKNYSFLKKKIFLLPLILTQMK